LGWVKLGTLGNLGESSHIKTLLNNTHTHLITHGCPALVETQDMPLLASSGRIVSSEQVEGNS